MKPKNVEMREECDCPYTFPDQVVWSADCKMKTSTYRGCPLTRSWDRPSRHCFHHTRTLRPDLHIINSSTHPLLRSPYLHPSLTTALPLHPLGTLNTLLPPSSHLNPPSTSFKRYLYSTSIPALNLTTPLHTGSCAVYPSAPISTALSTSHRPSSDAEPAIYSVSPYTVSFSTKNVVETILAISQAGLYVPFAELASHFDGKRLLAAPQAAGTLPSRRATAVKKAA